MTLKLNQLEAFRAVCRLGKITLAAREIGVSQPSVSRLIQNLGDQVGFDLFDRKDGRLVPTQESKFILREVSRLLDDLHHIEELTHSITHRKAGHLRIACLPGFATSHMPKVLARFLKDRPGVTVTLEPDRPERIMEWMITEQYDFGITDGFVGHPAVERTDVSVRTVCIFPDGHRLTKCDVILPRDLEGEQMIHTRRDSLFFQQLERRFQDEQVELRSHIEVRQFTAACELVGNGVGVSVVSELDAVKYQGHGVTFRPFEPALPHELSLVRPIHKTPSLITLEFMEHFQRSLHPFVVIR